MLCALDPVVCVGGVVHMLLADSLVNNGARIAEARAERLFSELKSSGANSDRIEVSLHGGAHGTEFGELRSAALHTVRYALDLPERFGTWIRNFDMRGPSPRKIYFHPGNAEIQVKRLDGLPNDTIRQRDIAWLRRLGAKAVG